MTKGTGRRWLRNLGVLFLILTTIVLGWIVREFLTSRAPPASYPKTVALADPAYSAAIEKARAFLDKMAPSYPGIAVAVNARGKTVWAEGRGFSDLHSGRKATDGTVFRIYSSSKAVTGALAAKLIEDGKISLDGQVGDYLNNAPPTLSSLRIWQLLSQTAGVRDYKPFEWFSVSHDHCDSAKKAIQRVANDELDFPPGTNWEYSSFNYVVLSAALEGSTGEPLADLFSKLIFGPSGMINSTLSSPPAGADVAVSYELNHLQRFHALEGLDNSCLAGAGGIRSSARDMAAFGSALLAGKIVSKDRVANLFVSFKTSAGEVVGYAMGWGVGKSIDGRPYAGHSGGSPGGRAGLVVFPNDDVAVGIAANLEGPRVVDEAAAIGALFAQSEANANPD